MATHFSMHTCLIYLNLYFILNNLRKYTLIYRAHDPDLIYVADIQPRSADFRVYELFAERSSTCSEAPRRRNVVPEARD